MKQMKPIKHWKQCVIKIHTSNIYNKFQSLRAKLRRHNKTFRDKQHCNKAITLTISKANKYKQNYWYDNKLLLNEKLVGFPTL